MKEIPLSVPVLSMNILENIRECIETGWISTGGRFISEFEKKVAGYVGCDDAVSTQSGTAGLHLALRVAGVVDGDEVVVPTLTFVAAVNPVKYIGAEPVFMDCDDSLCMDPVKLEKFCAEDCVLTERGLINKATQKKVAAVIVVHVFGNMADMEQIMGIAGRYGIKVIEDATEAMGTRCMEGTQGGKFAGTLGDIGVYSFNANKIITTGGGGMIVSKNQAYLDEARYLSTTAKNDALYFVHDEVGYNYRMLNIQAAFGVSQMDELESFIAIKKRNYILYDELLAGVSGITLLPFRADIRPNYWFYSIFVDKTRCGSNRDKIMKDMIGEGVQCRPVWKLIHTQRPYLLSRSSDITKAYEFEENVLNLPCSVNLESVQIQDICKKIKAKKEEGLCQISV